MNFIDTFFTWLRKGMVLTMFVIFGFAVTYTPIPSQQTNHYVNVEQAHAGGVPTWADIANLAENTKSAVQAASKFVLDKWTYLKDKVLDGIAWQIAKQLISTMVADTIEWINSGFEGSPAFVQDMDDYLLRAVDSGVGEYINSLGEIGSFVCSPFVLDVKFSVALFHDKARVNRRNACKVTEIVTNFENFIDGDFRAGGWKNWFELTSKPVNTPKGQILAAKESYDVLVRNTEGEELTILSFGDGFLSGTTCDTAEGAEDEKKDCAITRPGSMVADRLNKVLGAGQDELVAADEFNEVTNALVSQLATKVIDGASGLLGLSGGTGYSYTGYSRGSFVADLADGTVNGTGSGGSTGADSVRGQINQNLTGIELINETISNLETAISTTATYINDLRAFQNNSLNEDGLKITADIYQDQAEDLRDDARDDLAEAQKLRTDYLALDTELATASSERRTSILNEQAVLIQKFSSLSAVASGQLDALIDPWDDLLEQNVEPPKSSRYCLTTGYDDPECEERREEEEEEAGGGRGGGAHLGTGQDLAINSWRTLTYTELLSAQGSLQSSEPQTHGHALAKVTNQHT